MHSVNFQTYVPLSNVSKSDKDGSPSYIIEGIASNGSRDLQGEVIKPEGLDISYLLSSGYIDYEHDKDSVIGVPINDGTYVDDEGLHLKALIFGDDPRVQKMFQLQEHFDQTGVDRNLGFSIEGKVLDRDSFDDSIVREVMVTGCALTYRPACDTARINSWSRITKSAFECDSLEAVQKSLDDEVIKGGAWQAGDGISPKTQKGGAAMRTESLEGAITTLAQQVTKLTENGVDASEMADKLSEELSAGNYSNTVKELFLQIYSGISNKGAKEVIEGEHFGNEDFQRAYNADDASGNVDEDDED